MNAFAAITSVRDLIAACRNGGQLVQLPLDENASASAEPVWVVRKAGAADTPVSYRIAKGATTGPNAPFGYPVTAHDGASLYRLTTRAP